MEMNIRIGGRKQEKNGKKRIRKKRILRKKPEKLEKSKKMDGFGLKKS
jgi:hypothetical protein